MKPRPYATLRVAIPLLIVAAVAEAAVVTGGIVYTKLHQTTLLTEPQPAAKAAKRVALGTKMKVDEVRGIWLHVSDGPTTGWVFKGNMTDTKPVEITDLNSKSGDVSDTTATAAARPLDEVIQEYANRHNLANSLDDVDWVDKQCHALSDRELLEFLQEKKKGEYQ